MEVVEEGYVLVVCGATAGLMVPVTGVLEGAALQEVGEREVVVGGEARAGPAAVFKKHRLIRVVSQPEVPHLQKDGVQSARGLSAAGRPNRPPRTLLFLTITSSSLFVTEVRVWKGKSET